MGERGRRARDGTLAEPRDLEAKERRHGRGPTARTAAKGDEAERSLHVGREQPPPGVNSVDTRSGEDETLS